MAHDGGNPPDPLDWLRRLEAAPTTFGFHVALRRFEATFREGARWGEAVHAGEEPLRVGQAPSLAFQGHEVAGFASGPHEAEGLPRLDVGFLGLWGPAGALPTHLTEYAYHRGLHARDETLRRFVDIFHHRMLVLFHRAWAQTQATVALDREDDDRFAAFVGALVGLSGSSLRQDGAVPVATRLHFAGRFASGVRNAEGLAAVVEGFLGVPAAVEQFVGEWLDLPASSRWKLGGGPATGLLNRTIVLGARVWSRTHKIRIVLGPLSQQQFEQVLPHSEKLQALTDLVRLYTHEEWDWDVGLILADEGEAGFRLGKGARLGWTTRLGRPPGGGAAPLVVRPQEGGRRGRAPSSAEPRGS